jgi:hypothetical protein
MEEFLGTLSGLKYFTIKCNWMLAWRAGYLRISQQLRISWLLLCRICYVNSDGLIINFLNFHGNVVELASLGFRSSAVKISVLSECDTVSLDDGGPTFRARSSLIFKGRDIPEELIFWLLITALKLYFETSCTSHPLMWRYIPKERRHFLPQLSGLRLPCICPGVPIYYFLPLFQQYQVPYL